MFLWIDRMDNNFHKCPKCKIIIQKIHGKGKYISCHNGELLYIPGSITIVEHSRKITPNKMDVIKFKKRK